MSTPERYCKGARVWLKSDNPEEIWRSGLITKDYREDSGELVVEVDDTEEELILIIKSDKDLPYLRNPDILIGENDLTTLSYLHEPAVLYNLKVRFMDRNLIYTYCGIVLVAINPYQEMPIYDYETIMMYRQNRGEGMQNMDPHIFAVAEEAFTRMERNKQDQSIIVSGESGAGKTVSAKYAMRYFATVGGSADETHIEKKVLASNPIMEAIGNAKTTRNDNSSRFGKYIEIDFNKHLHINGANMRTYLLEKSRVVFQSADERNYHIFYQIVAARNSDPVLESLKLGPVESYHYLNQGDSPTINGINDAELFESTRNAFSLLGFPDDTQASIFQVLAAILNLGNIEFEERGEDASTVKVDEAYNLFCDLMEVDKEQMKIWLVHRKIVSVRESVTKPMPARQARSGRDALAKHIYAILFDYIVKQINQSLASSAKAYRFLGVLDIYGFETFEINSFEQFCINYANEKLQQQFCQHVFKLEQEEYLREKIDWKFIDFYDNQPCINLIESRLGILDLLDEECKMPKGSDQSWVLKLYDKCSASNHFAKPRFSNLGFIVAHFADKVTYDGQGFLDKNRDTVQEEQINILRASQSNLVMKLFLDEGEKAPMKQVKAATVPLGKAPPSAGRAKHNRKSVGSQFRDSLNLLMQTLNATDPHYVRCIKPNDHKQPFCFEPLRAQQQLRACGVLETIRISAAGYPSRWTYQDFLDRYRVLIKSGEINREDMRGTAEKIIRHLIKSEDQYQFGKTKVFFRAGQVAYFEKLRSDRMRYCGILVQKVIRGWLARKRYMVKKNAVRKMQRVARGFIARRRVTHIRRVRAAIVIQKYVRRFVKRKQYLRTKKCIIGLQTRIRGCQARCRYEFMLKNAKAVVIQRHVRGWLARRRYHRTIKGIILIQCLVRRKIAKRILKKLKVEAKSVEHIKTLNKGLENKIISMQQKIGLLNKENAALKQAQGDFKELTAKFESTRGLAERVKQLEAEMAKLRSERDNLSESLVRRNEELVSLAKLKEDEFMERRKVEEEKLVLVKEKEELSAENGGLLEKIQSLEKTIGEMEVVSKEQDVDREEYDDLAKRYQNVIMEKANMEQKLENMRTQLAHVSQFGSADSMGPVQGGGDTLSPSMAHRRNPSDISININDLNASYGADEDMGYGSTRRRDDSRVKLDNIEWSGEGKPNIDVGLMLQLQQKVKQLERERDVVKVENAKLKGSVSPTEQTVNHIRMQEVEMENSKLKADLNKLRISIAAGGGSDVEELKAQMDALNDELVRRREECVQLKSVLADQARSGSPFGTDEFRHADGTIDDYAGAYDAQRLVLQQQDAELKQKTIEIGELRREIEALRDDNDRQQRLLGHHLESKDGSEPKINAIAQHELERLTKENLDLLTRAEKLANAAQRYKLVAKKYGKKLKDSGVEPSLLSWIEDICSDKFEADAVCRIGDCASEASSGCSGDDESQLSVDIDVTGTASAPASPPYPSLSHFTPRAVLVVTPPSSPVGVGGVGGDGDCCSTPSSASVKKKKRKRVTVSEECLSKSPLSNFPSWLDPPFVSDDESQAVADFTERTFRRIREERQSIRRATAPRRHRKPGLDLPPLDIKLGLREMPAVKHKANQDFIGMFAFEAEEIPKIIRALVIDLKPPMAKRMLPGLPAYIIFMMIRHTDHVNDETKFRDLMNAVINSTKKIVKRKHEDVEYSILWLTNLSRLIHSLKQYSGDKKFQDKNTPRQNSQSLCHFDLVDYRTVFTDIALWVHSILVRGFADQVSSLIIPAIMENEAIPGLSSGPSKPRSRAASTAVSTPSGDSASDPPSKEAQVEPQNAMDSLLSKLEQALKLMADYGVDPELVVVVLKQLYYYIGATALNCLLLRKNLCHWSKGMQIRYNISTLEQWARDKKLDVLEPLQPIIEAAQLLQARKKDEDVDAICSMCSKLKAVQIIKILNLYTPANDFEEKVSPTFIKKVSSRLQDRAEREAALQGQAPTLLMNTKTLTYAVKFPFNPSSIRLEDVEIPDAFGLTSVKKL